MASTGSQCCAGGYPAGAGEGSRRRLACGAVEELTGPAPAAGTSATPAPNLISRANPRPDPTDELPHLRGKLPRRSAPWGPFQQPFPVHHPGSGIQTITTRSIPPSDWCHRCRGDSYSDPGSRGNQGGAGAGWPLGSTPSLRSAEGRACLLPVPHSCRLLAAWPYSFPAPAANSWERISHQRHSSPRWSPP